MQDSWTKQDRSSVIDLYVAEAVSLNLLYGGGPTFTARFVEPFQRVFAKLPPELRPPLGPMELDSNARISIARAFETLERCVAHTRNPDLGIAAGLQVAPGTFGATDYAMHASANLKEGIATLVRNAPMISDTFEPRLDKLDSSSVYLQLRGANPRHPRAAGDFAVAAFYWNHLRNQLPPGGVREVWLGHPRPSDIRSYEAAFIDVALRFDAPGYGFRLSASALESPLPGRDALVHALISMPEALVSNEARHPRRFAHRVREAVLRSLTDAKPLATAKQASRQMRVSPRTLVRRLSEESTSYTIEREFVLHQLAKGYLTRTEVGFRELASALGFSSSQAFHRAFKRWTGETPHQYRKRRQPG